MPDEEQQAPLESPNATEAEQSVLASILVEPSNITKVAGNLQPSDFYRLAHQRIFRSMLAIHEDGNLPDLVAVTKKLREAGQLDQIGGAIYLSDLAASFFSSATVDYHAGMIIETKGRRQLIQLWSQGEKELSEAADIQQFVARIQQVQSDIALRASGGRKLTTLWDTIHMTIDSIVDRSKNPNVLPGIATGLTQYDDMTGGLMPGIHIFAGRPGMGKTQLAISFAHHAAATLQVPVLFASLEMSKEAVTRRWLAQVSAIDQKKLKFGRIDDGERDSLWGHVELGGAAQFVCIQDAVDGVSTTAGLRGIIKKQKPRLVVIDHLTHLHSQTTYANRNLEIGGMLEDLRRLATEEDLSIALLCQLSRASEMRQDKRPTLADLRDSGEIEQHADSVTMIYRDEYYNPETSTARNNAELIIRKMRDGVTGTAHVGFDGPTGRFFCLGTDHRTPTQKPSPDDKPKKGYRGRAHFTNDD